MTRDVAILGVGMYPWGKYGGDFADYGVQAARNAIKDANVSWRDVQFIAAAATPRAGYPGLVAAASYAKALGWYEAELLSCFGACTSGAQALAAARTNILSGASDVAIVIGADTTPKGFLKPVPSEHPDDLDWIRYRLGFTNPAYLALSARRRIELHGASIDDFSAVKVKNSRHGAANPNARYRFVVTLDEVKRSALIADPLRLFHICSTSDGAAAVVLSSLSYARRQSRQSVYLAAVSTESSRHPYAELSMPYIAARSVFATSATDCRPPNIVKAFEEAGVGPEDLSFAEVYDVSSASELDWYEHLGLCALGDAEALLRDGATALGGRIPVNPSGGLASLGEAPSAQVLAQVYELTRQLREQSGTRQIPNPGVGIALSQGAYGHSAAVILKR